MGQEITVGKPEGKGSLYPHPQTFPSKAMLLEGTIALKKLQVGDQASNHDPTA